MARKGDLQVDLGLAMAAYAEQMREAAKKDPMHGKTLKAMLTELVERYGWEELSAKISINCFASNPSLDSSLKFLRKTPWARNKVEIVYLRSIGVEPPVRKKSEPKPAASPREPLLPSRRPFKPRTQASPEINPWTGKPHGE